MANRRGARQSGSVPLGWLQYLTATICTCTATWHSVPEGWAHNQKQLQCRGQCFECCRAAVVDSCWHGAFVLCREQLFDRREAALADTRGQGATKVCIVQPYERSKAALAYSGRHDALVLCRGRQSN